LTPDFYYRNGGIYLVKRDVLISENSLYGSKVVPYIMGENKSIDIDNINEFKLAELEMLSNT
jgi:CMP-N-acetylneuraminic acid synthetase